MTTNNISVRRPNCVAFHINCRFVALLYHITDYTQSVIYPRRRTHNFQVVGNYVCLFLIKKCVFFTPPVQGPTLFVMLQKEIYQNIS